MVELVFQIGCFQAARMWVNESDIPSAVEFFLVTYGPLIERQNYAISMRRNAENVPELEK